MKIALILFLLCSVPHLCVSQDCDYTKVAWSIINKIASESNGISRTYFDVNVNIDESGVNGALSDRTIKFFNIGEQNFNCINQGVSSNGTISCAYYCLTLKVGLDKSEDRIVSMQILRDGSLDLKLYRINYNRYTFVLEQERYISRDELRELSALLGSEVRERADFSGGWVKAKWIVEDYSVGNSGESEICFKRHQGVESQRKRNPMLAYVNPPVLTDDGLLQFLIEMPQGRYNYVFAFRKFDGWKLARTYKYRKGHPSSLHDEEKGTGVGPVF